jgi:DNA-binding PadR family transcriptional regulator
MYYNELKLRILALFEESSDLDSILVRSAVSGEKKPALSEKAIEMALLRYFRMGLLSRTRKGRRFYYTLTEKGRARRDWLLRTK